MDGVVVVDKPKNITSHDVVTRVRRRFGIRRVGHIGTLDPMATGVLPLVVGQATRLASLLAVGPKIYEGLIRLGVATDCLLYTSPSPRDGLLSRMPSSA